MLESPDAEGAQTIEPNPPLAENGIVLSIVTAEQANHGERVAKN
jgi:hypothetical protein